VLSEEQAATGLRCSFSFSFFCWLDCCYPLVDNSKALIMRLQTLLSFRRCLFQGASMLNQASASGTRLTSGGSPLYSHPILIIPTVNQTASRFGFSTSKDVVPSPESLTPSELRKANKSGNTQGAGFEGGSASTSSAPNDPIQNLKDHIAKDHYYSSMQAFLSLPPTTSTPDSSSATSSSSESLTLTLAEYHALLRVLQRKSVNSKVKKSFPDFTPIEAAKKVLAHLEASEVEYSPGTLALLANIHANEGDADGMEEWLKKMKELRGSSADGHSQASIKTEGSVRAMALVRNGKSKEALEVLENLHSRYPKHPRLVIAPLHSIFTHYITNKDVSGFQSAMSLFERIAAVEENETLNWPDVLLKKMTRFALVEMKDPVLASNFVRKMKPGVSKESDTVVIVNMVLNDLQETCRKPEETIKLYKELKSNGHTPNGHTIIILLRAASKAKDRKTALEFATTFHNNKDIQHPKLSWKHFVRAIVESEEGLKNVVRELSAISRGKLDETFHTEFIRHLSMLNESDPKASRKCNLLCNRFKLS
jgi:hypothetical protein